MIGIRRFSHRIHGARLRHWSSVVVLGLLSPLLLASCLDLSTTPIQDEGGDEDEDQDSESVPISVVESDTLTSGPR